MQTETANCPPSWHYGNPLAAPQCSSPIRVLSVQEQMGTDPQSKLAAAINRLCDLLEGEGVRE